MDSGDAVTEHDQRLIRRIEASPAFHTLVGRRGRFVWSLSLLMVVLYFGFILLVAFAPELLGRPLADGWVTTIGIPLGVLLIVVSFVLTGIYVRRANREFDAAVARLIEELS